jgi:hypothetical protein
MQLIIPVDGMILDLYLELEYYLAEVEREGDVERKMINL